MYTHERGAGVSPEALQLSPAGFKSMVNPTRADPLNRCCRFQCLTRQRTNEGLVLDQISRPGLFRNRDRNPDPLDISHRGLVQQVEDAKVASVPFRVGNAVVLATILHCWNLVRGRAFCYLDRQGCSRIIRGQPAGSGPRVLLDIEFRELPHALGDELDNPGETPQLDTPSDWIISAGISGRDLEVDEIGGIALYTFVEGPAFLVA